ncbi:MULTISPECIES: D-TA family PLP-dependent enzyme [Cytobacillus]|uniref:Alanine racemase n=1 Tax=Cytobacillus oceanisediminis 2691 TaxID=1196031 RepID=A0A169FJM1_9BACI|nr:MULTISPECIES: D-TA family PLP-dependent enzyme [Cytobacillus]AND39131.1 alanine racemase [Cytobacillus oceanisediminis 2691]MBY0157668.1 D-TA family PLP-dependent enzyme [Cytobacillus firmus]MCM3395983.1 D-TA family PLP-dependent enzyme [Cytobacillus oceanisediminis]
MKYVELDTPALLIDREIMMDNLRFMQNYANEHKVHLRPHTKTHKMPKLARLQEELGAVGITVAKVGEAEIMAKNGLKNIFIANEIVGKSKIQRIRKLAETIDISFGIDNSYHVTEIEEVFKGAEKKAQVLIEIEVGEQRSGIMEESDFRTLLENVKACKHVELRGIFSHDGHSYKAENIDECKELYLESVNRTLHFARIAEEMGVKPEVISIGSTPPFMLNFEIPDGVTEIRPGTYILMDSSQANVIGTYERCAASVLTTIISKPTNERVITDVGAKGITAQTRSEGHTTTNGLGRIKEFEDVYIHGVFDEHAIIYNRDFRNQVNIGDKVQIIPNHICPVCNLYEKAYLLSKGEVVEEIPIDCRAKLQ